MCNILKFVIIALATLIFCVTSEPSSKSFNIFNSFKDYQSYLTSNSLLPIRYHQRAKRSFISASAAKFGSVFLDHTNKPLSEKFAEGSFFRKCLKTVPLSVAKSPQYTFSMLLPYLNKKYIFVKPFTTYGVLQKTSTILQSKNKPLSLVIPRRNQGSVLKFSSPIKVTNTQFTTETKTNQQIITDIYLLPKNSRTFQFASAISTNINKNLKKGLLFTAVAGLNNTNQESKISKLPKKSITNYFANITQPRVSTIKKVSNALSTEFANEKQHAYVINLPNYFIKHQFGNTLNGNIIKEPNFTELSQTQNITSELLKNNTIRQFSNISYLQLLLPRRLATLYFNTQHKTQLSLPKLKRNFPFKFSLGLPKTKHFANFKIDNLVNDLLIKQPLVTSVTNKPFKVKQVTEKTANGHRSDIPVIAEMVTTKTVKAYNLVFNNSSTTLNSKVSEVKIRPKNIVVDLLKSNQISPGQLVIPLEKQTDFRKTNQDQNDFNAKKKVLVKVIKKSLVSNKIM